MYISDTHKSYINGNHAVKHNAIMCQAVEINLWYYQFQGWTNLPEAIPTRTQ